MSGAQIFMLWVWIQAPILGLCVITRHTEKISTHWAILNVWLLAAVAFLYATGQLIINWKHLGAL